MERHGVERIPDAERDARPVDLFRLSFGGAYTFATAFLGSFPILFGLSFWQGLTAMVVGLVAGALILSPMALFGPRNGTNERCCRLVLLITASPVVHVRQVLRKARARSSPPAGRSAQEPV